MAQATMRDPRATVWLSLDPDADEPVTLARYLALALDPVTSLSEELVDELDGLHPRMRQVTAGLVAAMHGADGSFVMVLDDVHQIADRRCIELLRTLCREIPVGSAIALVSQGDPLIPLARSRATGSLAEIGIGELRFGPDDAVPLLRGAGAEGISPDDAARIAEQTEGWAVGMYLAGRGVGSSTGASVRAIDGNDRFIADYVRETMLDELDPDVRDFLVQSSVLEELSGPLCDAALEVAGSGAILERLERSNLLIVPLDHRRERYRYHHLFRDVLRSELDHHAPELVAPITARASAFCEREGRSDDAVAYAIAGGHADRVVELVVRLAQATYYGGQATVVRGWFEWLGAQVDLSRAPMIAVLGAWLYAMEGHPLEAERWLDAVDPDELATLADREVEGIGALLTAAMTRQGVVAMLDDAERGGQILSPGSSWMPTAALLAALAHLCLGDLHAARVGFERASDLANELGATVAQSIILAEIAIVCLASGDVAEAASYSAASQRIVERGKLQGYPTSTLTAAVAARIALVQGDHDRAQVAMDAASSIEPGLTYALPTIAVQTEVMLGTNSMGLGDLAAAERFLAHADDVVVHRADLGVFVADLGAARAELEALRTSPFSAPALTPAEARVLPLLTTHRSFREIGAELFISPHTVKTQAISIYRKLGVSSRGEAVRVAREIGLLAP
jgi:LuxR family maltose regulon positive regulatory protein